MQPLLDQYNVKVVALSKDTVAQAAKHKKRDNLTFTLLADPKLKVIDKYGLIHRNGFEFFTIFLWGFPLGVPIGFRRMAIPTTLLIDENGIVRWIDQADDYRLRGDERRIKNALENLFSVN